MNDFNFDEESHVYTLNGNRLPSVTEIISKAGLSDCRYFTELGRLRGTAVHTAILFDIFDDLYFDGLHDIVKPYVKGWLRFKKDTGFIPDLRLSEKPQYHPLYLYAGKPDTAGLMNGRYILPDIKTGDSSTARFQTAAYAEFPEIKQFLPDRFDLRLYPNGSYKLNAHLNENDWPVFLNALMTVQSS